MTIPLYPAKPRAAVRLPDTVRQLAPFLALALLVKAVLLFAVLPVVESKIVRGYGVVFADDYDKLGRSLARGDGYRFTPDTASTLMREPGYPLLLAALFKVFGDHIEAARLANLLLATAAALLIALLARDITGERTAAVVAVLVFLFHPATLISEARGGFEMLFVFLLSLFLLAVRRAVESGRYRDYAWAGASLGAVLLTRGTPLLFPAVILGYVMWRTRGRSAWLEAGRRVALLVAVGALVLLPWMIRNYAVSGTLTPTASVQGTALQTGQYLCANMSFDRRFQLVDDDAGRERDRLARAWGYPFTGWYYQYFYRTADEISFNRALAARAIDRYTADPGFWAGCMARNLFNFWFMGKSWNVTWLNMGLQVPFLLLAGIGAWRTWRQGRWNAAAAVSLLFVIYLYALHVPIHAQARYSVPVIPFLSIFVAIAMTGLWRGWRNRRRSDHTRNAGREVGTAFRDSKNSSTLGANLWGK